MTKSHQLGWDGDHVGRLSRLQTAVRILAEGRGKTSDRLERATNALATLRPEDFPEELRKRAILQPARERRGRTKDDSNAEICVNDRSWPIPEMMTGGRSVRLLGCTCRRADAADRCDSLT
jgi:hypothetical protein